MDEFLEKLVMTFCKKNGRGGVKGCLSFFKKSSILEGRGLPKGVGGNITDSLSLIELQYSFTFIVIIYAAPLLAHCSPSLMQWSDAVFN